MLSRRIEATAEEVCDDYVVTLGGDRRDYAHRLVDLAELSAVPMAAGVGIISLRSMLAQRVTRILDSSRSLSTRVGHALLAGVLIGGLLATLLAGLVGVGPRTTVAENEASEVAGVKDNDEKQDAEREPDENLITVRGRVIGPDGEVVRGADVCVLRWFWNYGEPKPLAQVKSDDDGRFEISYRKSQFFGTSGRPDQWREAAITAFAEGFGPGWVTYNDLSAGEEATIRLAMDDVPIEGRIVDLEGNAVSDAIIEISYLSRSPKEDLTEWLEAVQARQSIGGAAKFLGDSLPLFSAGRLPDITTDKEGRFRITEIGRERRLTIHVKGPTIVTDTLSIVTRAMEPLSQPAFDFPDSHDETNYGAQFEYAAAPSRPFEGVVRDAKTGEPIAGVEIWSTQFAGQKISGVHTIKTKTDENGRYRLEGMPKGDGNRVVVVPTDLPYFTSAVDVPNPPGIEPVELNIELHRGTWVTGRVTDKLTGKGVPARMYYIPFPDNQFAHDTPEFVERNHGAIQDRYRTAEDGTYRVVVLPGRGVVAADAIMDAYPGGQGYEQIPELRDRNSFMKFGGVPPSPKFPTAVKELTIDENDLETACDFALESGRSLTLSVVDPEGLPLQGVSVSGTREVHDTQRQMPDANFEIIAMRDAETRTVLLRHEERRLGKALHVTANEGVQKSITVQLEPLATVTGQLVGAAGEPVRGVHLRIDVDGEDGFGKNLRSTATDKEGRFHHDEFLPGLAYNILAEGADVEFAVVARKLEVQPGETVDLGTIDITIDERPEPVRTKPKTISAHQPAASKVVAVRGRVVDGDGNPVPNAQIIATQSRWIDSQYMNTEHRTMANARSGADGTFKLAVPKVEAADYRKDRLASFAWKPPAVMATVPGHLSTWVSGGEMPVEGKDPFAGEVTLRLDNESPTIRGRLVNLEGQPLSGLNVQMKMLAVAEPGKVDAWLANVERLRKEGKLPRADADFTFWSSAMVMSGPDAALKNRQSAYFPMETRLLPGHPSFPAAVQSDAQGRFEITGLPLDCLAELEISGPGVMTDFVSVVTRDIQRIDVPNTSFAGGGSSGYNGLKFDHPVAPGTAILGTLTDADSNKPIQGARVMASTSMNRMLARRPQAPNLTDANGRFQIDGLPIEGERRLSIEPPPAQPYLAADYLEVPASSGSEPVEMAIKLRRGVLVRGKVTDQETGEPIDATIHYYPLLTNKLAEDYGYDPQQVMYDDGARYRTAADGSFEAVVIPGQGILGAQTVARGEHCVGLGAENIEVTERGQFATYDFALPMLFNRVVAINVPADAETIEQNLTVSRGVSQTVRVVDPQGQPLPGVRASGTLPQGFPSEDGAETELIEFTAMRPGETRRAVLLHKDRKLAAIANVTAPESGGKMEPITIQLQPCGVVTGRLVDGDGAPVVGLQFTARVQPPRDFDVATPQQVTTDKDGAFKFDLLPGDAVYVIGGHNQQIGYVEVAKELELAPGETVDLGTIDVTSKDRLEPVRTQASAAASGTANDGEHVQVRGRVVDAQGNAVKGANVLAAWGLVRGYAPAERFEHDIIAQANTNDAGEFELSVSTKQPENRRHYGWHVVAFAPGAAPAWIRDVDVLKNPALTMQLAEDAPLRGRIVDLEGRPLAGVNVRVHELYPTVDEPKVQAWLAEATEKTPPQKLGDYLFASTDKYPSKFPTKIIGRLSHGSPALPADVQTDSDGRFELNGLGANRLAIIEVKSLRVAKSNLHVVNREMAPVSAKPLGLIGVQSGTYYGRNFEFVAEPTQPIEGTVTDADTAKPIAGIVVRAARFANTQMNQRDFLTTPTDEQGRYRLVGAPQGGGHHLEVVPELDQPYFVTEKELEPTAASFDPIACDFALKRGQWITGKITDETTGTPIVDAIVNYLPLRTNEHARDYANYRPETNGSVPDQRFRSSADGSFRVLAISGDGVLAAIVDGDDSASYATLAGDQVPKHLVSKDGYLNAYEPWVVTGYHALREVQLADSADEAQYDLEMTAGLTRQLKVVDTEAKPVSGVRVVGRARATELELPAEGSTITVVGLRPNEQRPVALVHLDKQIGKALAVDAGDELTIELEPCAFARGRVLDQNGDPVSGLEVGVSLEHDDNWHRALAGAKTDSEGRFEVLLPPGATCRIAYYSNGLRFSALCKPTPGLVFELGDLTNESDLTVEQTAAMVAADQSADYVVNSPALAQSDGAKDDDSDAVVEYAGKVVTPDGQPAAQARVFLVYHIASADEPLEPTWKPIATTDASGEFRASLKAGDITGNRREWSAASIVATADGFGFARGMGAMYETSGTFLAEFRERVKDAPPQARESVERLLAEAGQQLRLTPDDVPIRGQIVDINGQPVAGAKLAMLTIYVGEKDLAPWLAATKAERADYYSTRNATPDMMNGPQVRSLVAPAVTDAGGRFTLRGIGRERIAELLVTGPNIQSEKIFARTQAGEPIELLQEWRSPDLGKYTYYPAEFTFVAGPSRPIVGVVRDRETQQPLAGVTIKSQHRHGHAISGWGQDFVRTTTGAEGRYRLEGMPIGEENRIAAIAPSDQAYLPMSESADTRANEKLTEVNFDLPPAVWVEGKVADKQTGEGLPGWVTYHIYPENPHLKRTGRLGHVDLRDRYQASEAGRFRIPVLPGGGAIGFTAFDHQKYPRATSITRSDGTTRGDGNSLIPTESTFLMPSNHHIVVEINPAEDAKNVELKLELSAEGTVRGRVVDPDGNPVTGFYYCGRLAKFATWEMARGEEFEIVGYQPNEPRSIYVVDAERKLAGSYVLKGPPPQELTVKLQPAGKVTGRVLGDDGEPLGNLMLTAWNPANRPAPSPAAAMAASGEMTAPLPPNAQNQPEWATDDEGRFAIDGLIPGIEYRLKVVDRESMSRRLPLARMPRVDGGLDGVIVVEPSESLDLGDVRVVDDAKFEAQAREAEAKETPSPDRSPADGGRGSEQTKPAADRGAATEFNGRVTGPDGKPIAGANVAIIGMTHTVARGGDFDSHRSETCGEVKTDDDGRFRLVVTEAWEKSHRFITLIAGADGKAVTWKQLGFDAPSDEVSFTLEPEEVIKGRLIDIEGQPAAGMRLNVRSVMARALPVVSISIDGIGYRDKFAVPAAWPVAIVTDAEGRFTVHDVGRNRGVMLDVEGSDRFAPQELMLNTGASEQRGERDGTYRPLVKNVKPGEEAVLPLAPALIFEGTVRYEDTDKPAPHARLTIWASQQPKFGSMISVAGNADADGRYRINPKPGVRFGVTAYPPDGAPYLTRKLPEVRREGGEMNKSVDGTLPRGVMVRGKVVDSVSGAPVAKATVQYVPESVNNKYDSDEILAGWQGIQISNDDGEFEIVVLPGPGRILVHCPGGNYVLQETSSRELDNGRPGGQRNYAHAIQRIEPEPGSDNLSLTAEVEPGANIVGNIVDEQGKPVSDALVISPLNMLPTNLSWRGDYSSQSRRGQFELTGLDKDREYPTYFLDAKRRLGATFVLKSTDIAPIVILKPCGQATAQYVDADGQPLKQHHASLHLVVTPGAGRYDFKAAEGGELLANSDFVSNIDRTNHWNLAPTDDDGRITFPALIPGATYRITTIVNGDERKTKEFTVDSGQTLDLSEIVIDEDGKTAASKQPEKPAVKPQAAGNVLTGNVVGHDGQPVAGAEIHWLSWSMRKASPPQRVATTDEHGLFKFTAPDPPPVHDQANENLGNQLLVIKAEGHGLALVRPHQLKQTAKPTSWLGHIASGFGRSASSHQAVTLPAADVPLRGRLVDIDGQPVAGAKVRVREMSESLQQYRARDPQASAEKQSVWQQRLMDMLQHFAPPELPLVAPSAISDTDGRFTLAGVGRDQVVELLVQGDRIESTLVLARTETGEGIMITPDGNFLHQPAVIHGAEFTQVIGPSKQLIGKVVDLDTGEPISGAVVRTYAIHGHPLSTSRERQYLATVSDGEGNYRITGLPVGDENKLVAFATGDEPYVPSGHAADTSVAGEEIQHDFRLKRGVWAEGRVFDAKTKEPLTGKLSYYIFRDAELEKTVPGLRDAFVDELYFTNANGEFRVPVLAARGVLAFFYSGRKDVTAYPRGAGAESIDGAEQEQGSWRMYPTLPHYLLADNYWKVVEVHPMADQRMVRADMPLSSGTTVEVRALSATGHPVPDIDIFAAQFGWAQNRPSQFEVVGLQPNENRKVFAWQPLAKLAGGTSVNATMKEPAVVTMQASGSVRGRLVDEEGQPITDATIEPALEDVLTNAKVAAWPYQPGRIQNPDGVPVDSEGRFQIVGLAPGWQYTGRITSARMMQGSMREMIVGQAFEGVTVEPGEEKDLGNIVVKQEQ